MYLNGQNKIETENYYLWFDEQVGIENTGLNNGIRYKELYRIKDGKHKFYRTSSFIKGDIIYDEQPYYNIDLKYDLFEDQIIINLQTKNGNSLFQLIKDLISIITIDNKNFVNLYTRQIKNSSNSISGFHEILVSNNTIILYKKHKKIRNKQFEKIVYSKFKSKNEYYFFTEGEYYLIKSKGEISKIFPDYRKEINSFINNNRVLLNSNYDLFLIQLSQRLTNLKTKLNN